MRKKKKKMGSGESKSAPASTLEGNKSANASTLEGNKSAPAGKRTFKLGPKSSIDADTLSGVADVLGLDIDIESIAPNASFGMPQGSTSIGRSKVGQSPGRKNTSKNTRTTTVFEDPPSGAIQRGRTIKRPEENDRNPKRGVSHTRVTPEPTTASGQQNNVESNEQITPSGMDNELFARLARHLARKINIDISPTSALALSMAINVLGVFLLARWLDVAQFARPLAYKVSDLFKDNEAVKETLVTATNHMPMLTSLATVYGRYRVYQAKMTKDHLVCIITLLVCIGIMIMVSFSSRTSTVPEIEDVKSLANLERVVTNLSKDEDSAAFVLSILCDSASGLSGGWSYDTELRNVCSTLKLTDKISEKIITAFGETGKALWKMLSSDKIKRILNELLTKDAFIAFKNFRIGSTTKPDFEITKGDDGNLMGVLKLVSYVNKNKPNLWIARVAGSDYKADTPSGLAYHILSNVVETSSNGFTDQEINAILAGTYNQKTDDPTELKNIIKYLKSNDYTYNIGDDKLRNDITKAKRLIEN
jgi:hypothetical protein